MNEARPQPPAAAPETARGPILTARGVRKSYLMGGRALEVLRGIELTVRRGEFLALRGASGAGRARCCTCWAGWTCPTPEKLYLTDRICAPSPPAPWPGCATAASVLFFRPTICCPS